MQAYTKPNIIMVIGNTAGHNELYGHYISKAAQCLVKDCKCKFEDLIETEPVHKPMTQNEIHQCGGYDGKIFKRYLERGSVSLIDLAMIEENSALRKEFSYNDIKNTFVGLSLADPHLGIFGICPHKNYFR
jgi:hypothetical protein